ncbi:hypothetical protein QYF61_010025 [Mycteria americana]|uniref:Uncharacterized protein n=1 Tax=Mycteria americana TaxID=33587 RepID=A0AAN7NF00_MYCAM|nr:hypothetical protein QYF61_010025 [Mycteria americana]
MHEVQQSQKQSPETWTGTQCDSAEKDTRVLVKQKSNMSQQCTLAAINYCNTGLSREGWIRWRKARGRPLIRPGSWSTTDEERLRDEADQKERTEEPLRSSRRPRRLSSGSHTLYSPAVTMYKRAELLSPWVKNRCPHGSRTPATTAPPIPFTYPSPLPALPHLGIAEGDEQQREQIAEDKRANHVDLLVAWVGPLLPAKGLVAGVAVEEALVVSHWRGHGEGKRPDEPHAQQRVAGNAQGRGASGVHDGHVAVHRHGREREDAHQHGDGEEVVDELADEGAQHPGGEHVDRGLEGDAEEQVGQVGDAQVEDEDVGGAAALAWLAPRQHRDHQRVAQHPQGEDQDEDDQARRG